MASQRPRVCAPGYPEGWGFWGGGRPFAVGPSQLKTTEEVISPLVYSPFGKSVCMHLTQANGFCEQVPTDRKQRRKDAFISFHPFLLWDLFFDGAHARLGGRGLKKCDRRMQTTAQCVQQDAAKASDHQCALSSGHVDSYNRTVGLETITNHLGCPCCQDSVQF
jgi:hypothetical protein